MTRQTYDLCDDYAVIEENIIELATKYIENSGVKSLVIGLSGGIDSTVTCALAREVCDRLSIKLIGVSLPTNFNKTEEVTNAAMVGEAFCDRFRVYRIEKVVNNVLTSLSAIRAQDPEGFKIRRGNVAARVRMIYLYHIAHQNNGLVLSTDNLTELLLGFWTLHGDVGDFGMIQDLRKTEVYGLAHHLFCKEKNELRALALSRSCKAVPTDGLGVSESDLDQIGAGSYAEVDDLLTDYFNGDRSNIDHPVIQRHLRTHFKRNNPYNLKRENIIRKRKPFLVSWGRYDAGNEEEVYVLENMEEVSARNAGDAIEKASVPRGVDWVESLLVDEHVKKMIANIREEAGEDS